MEPAQEFKNVVLSRSLEREILGLYGLASVRFGTVDRIMDLRMDLLFRGFNCRSPYTKTELLDDFFDLALYEQSRYFIFRHECLI